jgi:hypothetical protein
MLFFNDSNFNQEIRSVFENSAFSQYQPVRFSLLTGWFFDACVDWDRLAKIRCAVGIPGKLLRPRIAVIFAGLARRIVGVVKDPVF